MGIEEKLLVRDYAHKTFQKSFDFLQLKDPKTFIDVQYLGQDLTKGDEAGIWDSLRKNQQKILADKKIKHRSFGIYAKHNCPYEDCPWNGVMLRQGSRLEWSNMHFDSDRNRYPAKEKSEARKTLRKNEKLIIIKELDIEI